MPYEERLKNMITALHGLSDRMDADQDAASTSFTSMRDSAKAFLHVMNNALQSPYSLTEAQRNSIPILFQSMLDSAQHYFESHDSLRFTTSGGNRRDLSSALVTLLRQMQPLLKDYSDALQMSDHFHASYANGREEPNISRLDDLFTSAVPRMKPADCFAIENPNFGTAAIFGKFAYLARQEAALHPESVRQIRDAQFQNADPNPGAHQAPANGHADPNPAQAPSTIYQDAYRTMSAKLAQASFTEQMNFAQMLERHRISLLDRLSDSLERYRRESQEAIAAGREAGPDPLVRLYTDPDYRKLESLTLLEDKLGTEAKKYAEHFRTNEHYSERPSVVAMHDYMPGQEETFLTEEQRAQARILREEADRASLAESSYRAYESCLTQPAPENRPVDLRPLFDTYSQMMRDKESASPYFQAVRDRLGSFLSMNHSVIADPLAYDANLTMAMQAVKTYLDTHRGHIVHTYGQNRRALIERTQRELSNLHTAFASAMEARNVALTAIENAAAPEQREELRKLNRLHHLTSSSFVPTPRRTDFTPTRKTKILGGVMHGLASLVVGVSSIISMPLWGLNRLRHRNDEFIQDAHDYERIPGYETREHFRNFDPDKSSANQPILADPRRVPCVWETKTGGDPSQPPTISINAKQAHEGDLHASGGFDQEVGHTSMTLEYTKNDPITGKPQRYRTTFGFYPRTVVNGRAMSMSAIASEGGKGGFIPGDLQNDSDLHAHASITYTANNRQINKILVAAQTYAQGGYNMITRNCATFAKDMADLAGLDTKGLFHENDFELGFTRGLGTAFALPVQDYFRMYGNHKMVGAQGQINVDSYQILGQQQVTSRDVVHYTQTKAMNFRLKGYNPSRLAEAIKASGRGNLMTTASDEEKNPRFPDEDTVPDVYVTQILANVPKLTAAVENSCREQNLPEAEISKILNSLGTILSDSTSDSMTRNLNAAFKTQPGHGRSGRELYHEKEAALTACSADLTALQNKLNRFYQDVLHNQKDLYQAFHDVTSLFTDVKIMADAKLSDLDNVVVSLIHNPDSGYLDDLADEIDPNLEDAEARRTYRFVHIDQSNRLTDIPTLAASALLYPDGASYVTDRNNLARLEGINKEDLTAEQRKQKERLETRRKMVDSTALSMSYYASTASYTKGDLDFIFGKLARCETANNYNGLSAPFQGFVWGKLLPPTQARINEAADRMIDEHILADPNRVDERAAMQQDLANEVSKIVTEALCHDRDSVKRVLRAIAQDDELHDFGSGAETSSNNQIPKKKFHDVRSFQNLFRSLKESRFYGQVQTAVTKALRDKGVDASINRSRFSNAVTSQLGTNLNQILNYVLNPNMLNDPQNHPAPEIIRAARDLSWIKEELDAMPGFCKAFAAMSPSLVQYENQRDSLAARQHRTQEETRRMNGLQILLDHGKNALKSLTDQAALGRQSFNNQEKKEILQNLARVSFILYMNKLSADSKNVVLAKLGQDRSAYDRYIDRIAKSESFRSSMKNINLNDLATSEGITDLNNRCSHIFTNEFYRQVHVSGIRQPAPIR